MIRPVSPKVALPLSLALVALAAQPSLAAEIQVQATGPVIELVVNEQVEVEPDEVTISAGVTNQAMTAQEALSLCLQHGMRASTVNYTSIARVHRRLISLAPSTDERLQRYKSALQLVETLQQGVFPDAEMQHFFTACWNVGHRFTQNELYLDAERFLSVSMSFADRISAPQLQPTINQCHAQYSQVIERSTPTEEP